MGQGGKVLLLLQVVSSGCDSVSRKKDHSWGVQSSFQKGFCPVDPFWQARCTATTDIHVDWCLRLLVDARLPCDSLGLHGGCLSSLLQEWAGKSDAKEVQLFRFF